MRGLARGLGSKAHVSSPTFKLSNEYVDGRLKLYHFDFYRLSEAGIMSDELAEIMGQPTLVAAIEWGDVVHDVLPPQKLTITFTPTSETSRQLQFQYPAVLDYLVGGLL